MFSKQIKTRKNSKYFSGLVRFGIIDTKIFEFKVRLLITKTCPQFN
jgi:hypothetical protein